MPTVMTTNVMVESRMCYVGGSLVTHTPNTVMTLLIEECKLQPGEFCELPDHPHSWVPLMSLTGHLLACN